MYLFIDLYLYCTLVIIKCYSINCQSSKTVIYVEYLLIIEFIVFILFCF